MHAHVHTHAHTRARTRHTHARTHAHTHARTHAHTHTHTRAPPISILQVELALSVEQRFPRSVRRFFITGMLEVAPNRSLSLWEQFAYQVWGKERFDSAENIAGAVKFIPPVVSNNEYLQ